MTGKFDAGSRLPKDDVRGSGFTWCESFFKEGKPAPEALRKLAAVGEILTSGDRTPAQGALGWIWAKSRVTVPIPGFKNVRQVEENAGAMAKGPLTAEQTAEIDRMPGRV